jgi:formylglycine-generating enzyme
VSLAITGKMLAANVAASVLVILPITLMVFTPAFASQANARATVQVPTGTYQPFFREPGEVDHTVDTFWIDKDSVTRRDFAAFLIRNPDLAPSKISSRLADKTYLEWWTGKSSAPVDSNLPVTSVSWFVARRYCVEKNGRLPTIAEWEYAAEINSPEALALISEWYAKPSSIDELPPTISSGKRNKFGVRGMHGLIWEWVEDFASVIIQGDSRSANDTDKKLYCAAGALSARNPTEYATFMRFAFRSSLKANSAARTLGFRCVYNNDPEKRGHDL